MSAPTDVFRCHFDGRNWWGRRSLWSDNLDDVMDAVHLFRRNPYEHRGEWAVLTVPAHMVEVIG